MVKGHIAGRQSLKAHSGWLESRPTANVPLAFFLGVQANRSWSHGFRREPLLPYLPTSLSPFLPLSLSLSLSLCLCLSWLWSRFNLPDEHCGRQRNYHSPPFHWSTKTLRSANTLTMPRKRYDANCTLQTSSWVVRARLQRFMTVVVVSLVIEVWLLDCLVHLGGKPDRGRSCCPMRIDRCWGLARWRLVSSLGSTEDAVCINCSWKFFLLRLWFDVDFGCKRYASCGVRAIWNL